MVEPSEKSTLTPEQQRRQELQQKIRELLGRLDEYLTTINRLETLLIAYPFKDQRIFGLLSQCREYTTRLLKTKMTLVLIVSQDISHEVLSSVKDAFTQLYTERQIRLPMEGDSFLHEVQKFTEQEESEVQHLEGVTQEFSGVIIKIQSIIQEAEKQFKGISEGDFRVVIATLQKSLDELERGKGIVEQMQNPAVVGEERAQRYAERLTKFKQVIDTLMRSLTGPNLNQTIGTDKEYWKKSYYGEFQLMLSILHELKERREVLELRDHAMGKLGEIQTIENKLRSLQLRDIDIPNSLE